MAYEIIDRVWLAQPRLNEYQHCTWIARKLYNQNVTEPEHLVEPFVPGCAHEPFELYYHVSIVEELKERIKELEEMNGAGRPSPNEQNPQRLKPNARRLQESPVRMLCGLAEVSDGGDSSQ